MKRFRTPLKLKFFAWTCILALILQIGLPVSSYALTSGPIQPEHASFEPIGTTQMVDLFTGDFNYNIPLFDIPGPNGGYPINLFYESVTNGEQEASMVGLGWNVGIGAINRSIRGVPDDFNGENVKVLNDQKNSWTATAASNANAEIFGLDNSKAGLTNDDNSLKLGLTLNTSYNNYRGLGASFNPVVSLIKDTKRSNGSERPVPRLELGTSLNAFENNSIDVSGTLPFEKGDRLASLSNSINTQTGIQKYNLTAGSYGVSFEKPTFIPQYETAYRGNNFSFYGGVGGEIFGILGATSIRGSFREQEAVDKGKWVSQKSFGSMHLDEFIDEPSEKKVLDFYIDKDGPIRYGQRNLGLPIGNEDIVSATGHGIGGSFMLKRSDIGVLTTNPVRSVTSGQTYGFQVGVGMAFNSGGDINFTISEEKNLVPDLANDYPFSSYDYTTNYEPFYYKRMGELSATLENDTEGENYEYIGGMERIQLVRNGMSLSDQIIDDEGNPVNNALTNDHRRSNREPRSNVIQQFTYRQLIKQQPTGDNELIPYFNLKIYDFSEVLPEIEEITDDEYSAVMKTGYDRLEGYSNTGDQVASFTVTSPEGFRWNYGLPVKNFVKREVTYSHVGLGADPFENCSKVVNIPYESPQCDSRFIDYHSGSTDKSDDMINVVETPAHAQSYLLTSVLGTDYIDIDPSDGSPRRQDIGYWMNIDYLRIHDSINPYKWRTPYTGANYNPGKLSLPEDDKATFMYGERETYFPAEITTRTHRLVFYYGKRDDARSAECYLQNNINWENIPHNLRLDSIHLYSQLDNFSPIKSVHFEYDTENPLAPNTPNSESGGKLTLKKVFFKYHGNARGMLNPYEFQYGVKDANGDRINVNYNPLELDRWGVYNGNGTDCEGIYDPYTAQSSDQEDIDKILSSNAMAWHLRSIKLPSGSMIEIQASRDHYGYVQDRVAGQMFKFAGINGETEDPTADLSKNGNKIYFELEEPIPDDAEATDKLEKYFEDLYQDENGKQVYFKVRSELIDREHSEDIGGYAYIQEKGFGTAVNGMFESAWVELDPYPGADQYDPMLVSIWQFIKTNTPALLTGYEDLDHPSSVAQKIGTILKLLDLTPSLKNMIKNYFKAAYDEGFGKTIDLANSYLRLNTPDKIKYGGGIKVDKVLLKEIWDEEAGYTPAYGTLYNYTIEDDNGDLISSGVAANEPSIGDKENILKYAKYVNEDLKHYPSSYHFFEYPIGEQLYPGASIGYSNVEVLSLPSSYALDKANEMSQQDLIDKYPEYEQEIITITPPLEEFSTTGKAVHEFYTARDFPIISRETPLNDRIGSPKFIPLPFVGSLQFENYTGTQGYMLEFNDMHGKPKKTTYFSQNKSGEIIDQPVSFVEYKYKQNAGGQAISEGTSTKAIGKLDNNVKVLTHQVDPQDNTISEIKDALLGVDISTYISARSSSSNSGTFNIDLNADGFVLGIIPAFIPTAFPEVTAYSSETDIATITKVIYRHGIVDEVIAGDGQSIVSTKNLLFAANSGKPLLTSVSDQYDQPVYNLTLPAYFQYDGMGPAYQNAGVLFSGDVSDFDNCLELTEITNIPGDIRTVLHKGDEFILLEDIGTGSEPELSAVTRATFIRESSSRYYFNIDLQTLGDEYYFLLYRSGKRNMLNYESSAISALNNPTENLGIYSEVVPVQTVSNPVNETVESSIIQNCISATASTYTDVWNSAIDTCSLMDPPIALPQANPALQAQNCPDHCGVENSCCYWLFYNFEFLSGEPACTTCEITVTWLANGMEENASFVYPTAATCTNGYLLGCYDSEPEIFELNVDYECNSSNCTEIAYGANPNEYIILCNSVTDDCDDGGGPTLHVPNTPFREGYRGIWRKHQDFQYVDNRTYAATSDFRDEGKLDEVPLYLWNAPFFKYSDAGKKWKLLSEVSSYNRSGQASEEKNLLGVYNMARYGYNGDLVKCAGENMRLLESGFEGFEEISRFALGVGGVKDLAEFPITLFNGNIDFSCDPYCYEYTEAYNIVGAYTGSGNVLIDKPFTQSGDIPESVAFRLQNSDGKVEYYSAQVSGTTPVSVINTDELMFAEDNLTELIISGTSCENLPTSNYGGRAVLKFRREYNNPSICTNVAISSRESHTGTSSLMLGGVDIPFYQERMKLQDGQDYIISAWMKVRAEIPLSTYANNSNGIYVTIGTNSMLFEPAGPVIEGWQRIEGRITVDHGASPFIIELKAASEDAIWFDDFRCYPADGNMQSFVYDRQNYRLTEVLDNNNYFTRYIYDDQGQLVATMKETEDGIKTLEEQRIYQKPAN